ncbi:MAG TPA: HPP family protein [Allosphingosinicella sp.]|jgi:ATP synthase protein I
MAENEPFEDPELPRDARLDALDQRLRQARRAEAKRAGGRQYGGPSYYRSPAYRVLSVLVGYPLGSALIGAVIGRFTGLPILWVAMVFVGFAIAVWEVWKISRQSPD